MELALDGTERALDFLERIVERMLFLFPITRTEAVGRVNEQWGHLGFIADDDLIFHETAEYWAKTLYYGSDSRWWLGEEGLDPLPYGGPR